MPEQEPDFIADYLASMRAHLDDGTLDDGRLAELLGAIGSRHLRVMGKDRRLTARQHAAAKQIATVAIRQRGGFFPMGRTSWLVEEGRLWAELS
jgi:hypothetical protein